MKTKTLRKDEIKKLNHLIKEKYNINEFYLKKDLVVEFDVQIKTKTIKLILKNKNSTFFYFDLNEIHENLIPTLKLVLQDKNLYYNMKKITVDMGAVKFVINGADIMRQGITEFNKNIQKDDIVLIIDETHKKPLAIGKSLVSGPEIAEIKEGKVVENIHWVGDEIWKCQDYYL